jgi:hypothetical protein
MNSYKFLLWTFRDEFPVDVIYSISKFLPKKIKDESKVVVVKYKCKKECRYVQHRLNFRKLSF